MALQMLPHLLSASLVKTEEDKTVCILVATSGDTGKGALEGFKNVPRTKILVFYPKDGVSQVQELQMVTQEGGNVSVCAVVGNFDDAQTGVKKLFSNEKVRRDLERKGYFFSSANSINWGRVLPQIVYYISAYCDLLRDGEIDTVATDHCSFTTAQKRAGRYDFTKIPGGLPGVEHRGVLLYTHGVAAGRITPADMCRVLCENPAKLYGCWPRKGCIAPGGDGDIVVYDPAARGVITAADQAQNTDYTPYEGMETAGAVEQVYLRGRLAADRGRVLETQGQFIRRGPCAL